MARLILFNKPYDVLCQFTDPQGRPTLADFVQAPGCYPAGRLDRDSEGLLVLTDDGALQARITHPRHKLPKTYWIQVEGEPSIKDAVGHPTLRLVRVAVGPWRLEALRPGQWTEIEAPRPGPTPRAGRRRGRGR